MKIMGILNVTPDSFSDGGLWLDPERAIAHAVEMDRDGADIVDVGAESTRPGSSRMNPGQEWDRLGRVLPQLIERGITVSVDTVHAETAKRAIAAGASFINDISGGCFDPEMNRVVAASDAGFVIQHWRGFPGTPGLDESYFDPVTETLRETLQQVNTALTQGVRQDQIIIDPGLGFALTGPDSWSIVNNLELWVESPYPVLVGGSRKRFVREKYPEDIEAGTLAVTRKCLAAGAWGVRVHDVARSRQVVRRSGADNG